MSRPCRRIRRPPSFRAAFTSTLYETEIENTVTWSRAPGEVAIWDNRATQHYAPANFNRHRRKLQRITVAGDVPVALDGRMSRLLIGPNDGRWIDH